MAFSAIGGRRPHVDADQLSHRRRRVLALRSATATHTHTHTRQLPRHAVVWIYNRITDSTTASFSSFSNRVPIRVCKGKR